MQTLTVHTPSHAYPIIIGNQLLSELSQHLAPHIGQKAAIITNQTIAPLYLATVQHALDALGIEHFDILLNDGEQYKNWQSLNHIFDVLLLYLLFI